MVMQSKCPFCDKTYGDAEEHYCKALKKIFGEDERKAWENTLAGQAEEARKALRNFSETILKEVIKFGRDKE